MKQILIALFALIFSTSAAFCADMRFVQVSDLNFSEENNDFEQLIDKINNEKKISFVVFSGNNISKPNKDLLESFLKKANHLKSPYYVILGNKDVNKQKNLSKNEYLKITKKYSKAHKKIEKPNYFFEKNKVLFVVADGSKEVIPTQNGYYKDDVLEWLDGVLTENKNKNVVILQHFPIVAPAKKENYYTFRADEYLKLLERHSNVKAVISGHFGVNNEQNVNNIMHISTQNAPVYRVIDIIDCDTKHPIFWSTIKE